MTEVLYLPAAAGAGKTRALVRHAHWLASRGAKVLFVQPSKGLIDRSVADELVPLGGARHRVIHGGTEMAGVVAQIVAHVEAANPGGEVLFITHAAFLLLPWFSNRAGWHVIIDEVLVADVPDDKPLPDTHGLITPHLDIEPRGAAYGLLTSQTEAERIARNVRGDRLYAEFQDVLGRIVSPHWDVFASLSGFADLVDGRAEGGTFRTFSLLKPSVIEGFAEVIMAGACFEETLLYRLWTAQGVRFELAGQHLLKELRYTHHANGHLVTIRYACEEAWSKSFRDKRIEGGGTVGERVVTAIKAEMAGEPFVWMGNKDQGENLFGPNATKLPNSPHGLNGFQGFHRVAVLSALNPPPAHFAFLEAQGISGDEVRAGLYRCAVYQAVMRCSVRNPADLSPKTFVVMDRDTAEWLAARFPGARVAPLDGMGVVPRKGQPGRPALHGSDAAKTAASRARMKQDLLADLVAINERSFREVGYDDFIQFGCNENPSSKGDIVTPFVTSPSSGTAYATIYDTVPLGHLDYTDDDAFIAWLRDLHQRVLASKDEAGLISPAHMDPARSNETSRGLDNVMHLRGVWLDNDGGHLGHEDFVRLFPHLRIVVWNTYRHTPADPRWRAFIPTTQAMSAPVHKLVLDQIEHVLNRAGYWSKKRLEADARIKVRREHGFDLSKFNAASLFYLPAQARNPKDSFFLDHDLGRGPLDVRRWINECILKLRPEPDAIIVPAVMTAPKPTAVTLKPDLQRLSDKLKDERQKTLAGQREDRKHEAIEVWRATCAIPGTGHDGFFGLGAALHRAGLDPAETTQTLREEAGYARSPKKRRGEIKGIMRTLGKSGSFWGRS